MWIRSEMKVRRPRRRVRGLRSIGTDRGARDRWPTAAEETAVWIFQRKARDRCAGDAPLVVIAEALGDVVGDPSPHLARVALDPCVGGQRLEQRTKRRRVSGHDGGQVFAFWRTLREAPPVPDTTPRISRDEKLARAMPQPTRRVGSRSTGLDLVPRSAVRVRGSGSSEKRDCQRTFKNCSRDQNFPIFQSWRTRSSAAS